MSDIRVGDQIEHVGMRGFPMTVLDIGICEDEDNHSKFQVTDPDGFLDWLCERDVVCVSS
jgi:hypothetical protein